MIGSLFFISILGYALFIKYMFKKISTGSSIFSAFCWMVAVSYVFVFLLGLSRPTAYGLMYGGIFAFCFFSVYFYVKNRHVLREFFLTPSFAVFCVFTIFAILVLHHANFKYHDDFSFWGRAVRELYTFDQPYFTPYTTMAHMDYHPAFASLQYTVVRAFGWKNEYLYYIIAACMISTLSLLTDYCKVKRYSHAMIVCGLFVYLFPVAYITYTISFLGTDGSLALLFTGGLISWLFRSDTTFPSLFPLISAAFILPGVKLYSGLLLSFILWGSMFISCLRASRRREGHEEIALQKRNLFHKFQGLFFKKGDHAALYSQEKVHPYTLLFSLFLIILMQVSWSGYYNYHSDVMAYEKSLLQAQYIGQPVEDLERPTFSLRYLFKGNPRNQKLFQILSEGTSSDTSTSVVKQGVKAILYEKICGDFTTFSYSALLLFSLYLMCRFSKSQHRATLWRLFFTLIFMAVVYTAGTLVTLLVQPGAVGGTARYMGVIANSLLLSTLFVISYLITAGNRVDARIGGSLLVGYSLLAILFVPLNHVVSAYRPSPAYVSTAHVENTLPTFQDALSEDDRALLIDNLKDSASNSAINYIYQYELLPTQVQCIYHPYGKTEDLSSINAAYLESNLTNILANKLVVMTDDPAYTQVYAELLGIDVQTPQPWVLDVSVQDGVFHYTLCTEP